MANSQIGLKIADGSFYPVLEEGTRERKRLVVTTVGDNQENVHINLYRSSTGSMEKAEYVGSLVIENITPAPRGEPEVEVVLGIDEEDNLNAFASDTATGNRQSLSTSLEGLEGKADYTIPDFELDEELAASESEAEDRELTGAAYPIEAEDRRKTHLSRGKNNLFRILFIILGIVAIAAVTYLLYRVFQPSESVEPLEIGQTMESEETGGAAEESAASLAPAEAPPEAQEASEEPAAEPAPAGETAAAEPAEAEKPPAGEGIWYRIKWGDTLWDISATYYRNPWLYPVIAENPNNNIKDPDFILAGFPLFIPKR